MLRGCTRLPRRDLYSILYIHMCDLLYVVPHNVIGTTWGSVTVVEQCHSKRLFRWDRIRSWIETVEHGRRDLHTRKLIVQCCLKVLARSCKVEPGMADDASRSQPADR